MRAPERRQRDQVALSERPKINWTFSAKEASLGLMYKNRCDTIARLFVEATALLEGAHEIASQGQDQSLGIEEMGSLSGELKAETGRVLDVIEKIQSTLKETSQKGSN